MGKRRGEGAAFEVRPGAGPPVILNPVGEGGETGGGQTALGVGAGATAVSSTGLTSAKNASSRCWK